MGCSVEEAVISNWRDAESLKWELWTCGLVVVQ